MKKKSFIPNKHADTMKVAGDYNAKITAPGFDPTTVDLTPADVTQFTGIYTAAKAGYSDSSQAKDNKKSKTGAFSGPGGLYQQMVGEMRRHGNIIHVSKAPDAVCTNLGVDRRSPTHTRKTAPADAPEFTLEDIVPGKARFRTSTLGDVGHRNRPDTASGIQIAIVDGTTAIVSGEADSARVVSVSRSPFTLNTSDWPAKARLYARWETQRKEVSGWSLPLLVTVL